MNAKFKLLVPVIVTLTTACTSPLGSPPSRELLGDPAPVSAATRTIVITPNTKYVNVTGGETVKFVVGDKSFAWNFDASQYFAPVDLRRIAPPNTLDHPVTAYLEPNPLYRGGGDRSGNERHGGGQHSGGRGGSEMGGRAGSHS